jgi:hypothetical protein
MAAAAAATTLVMGLGGYELRKGEHSKMGTGAETGAPRLARGQEALQASENCARTPHAQRLMCSSSSSHGLLVGAVRLRACRLRQRRGRRRRREGLCGHVLCCAEAAVTAARPARTAAEPRDRTQPARVHASGPTAAAVDCRRAVPAATATAIAATATATATANATAAATAAAAAVAVLQATPPVIADCLVAAAAVPVVATSAH